MGLDLFPWAKAKQTKGLSLPRGRKGLLGLQLATHPAGGLASLLLTPLCSWGGPCWERPLQLITGEEDFVLPCGGGLRSPRQATPRQALLPSLSQPLLAAEF